MARLVRAMTITGEDSNTCLHRAVLHGTIGLSSFDFESLRL